ncbi:hypothetical protein M427DRAFT_27030 [Gonapodya prolifera JEL478]|uniref:Uncharacterized protein n=1 Tax=Gonapodya prolifera (strain JEL478) TaxID=1344416 RepID=A0A139B0I8_GONPJ|nr:hypothetical protein M427DRAFT_27030 [Gonapodya prolifera JEL478]|eukprot:KXS22489.1 hypothetical protein M427DRAFT_27030 [Gonapodya prolifera JEL478]
MNSGRRTWRLEVKPYLCRAQDVTLPWFNAHIASSAWTLSDRDNEDPMKLPGFVDAVVDLARPTRKDLDKKEEEAESPEKNVKRLDIDSSGASVSKETYSPRLLDEQPRLESSDHPVTTESSPFSIVVNPSPLPPSEEQPALQDEHTLIVTQDRNPHLRNDDEHTSSLIEHRDEPKSDLSNPPVDTHTIETRSSESPSPKLVRESDTSITLQANPEEGSKSTDVLAIDQRDAQGDDGTDVDLSEEEEEVDLVYDHKSKSWLDVATGRRYEIKANQ